MRFPSPLLPGHLLGRRKRFFADIRLDTGEEIVAHCPNSGSMRGCAQTGSRVWVSSSDNPARTLRYTWEIGSNGPNGEVLLLVHTGRPNALVKEALMQGRIPALAGYGNLRSEVPYGSEGSRIDFVLEDPHRPPCYLEVKNVTLLDSPGVAAFPDAVTSRGTRHLRELMGEVARGNRGVLVFVVSRGDVREVRPADSIDPLYGRTLREAAAKGVEILPVAASISPEEIVLDATVPILLTT